MDIIIINIIIIMVIITTSTIKNIVQLLHEYFRSQFQILSKIHNIFARLLKNQLSQGVRGPQAPAKRWSIFALRNIHIKNIVRTLHEYFRSQFQILSKIQNIFARLLKNSKRRGFGGRRPPRNGGQYLH